MAGPNIVIVNRFFSPDSSATSQIASDLVFRLASQGIRFRIITSRICYDSPGSRLPRSETRDLVAIRRVYSTGFGRKNSFGRLVDYLTFMLAAAWAALWCLSPGDVLVVKTDPPLLGVVLWPISKLRGARLVHWLQDLFPEVAREAGTKGVDGLGFRALRMMRDSSLHASDLVITISEGMSARITGLGVSPEKVVVCHNWALSTAQPVKREQNPLEAAWGLKHRFIVGYSGNLGSAHEIDTVARAGKLLRDEDDIVFLWIGGGSRRVLLEEYARSEDLKNWVFKPYQSSEDLAFSLSLPDIHLTTLLPSMEGLVFPSKLYGILAAGRPILFVGAGGSEVASLLERYECGISIPAGSPELLAATVKELVSEPEKLARMGLAARRAHEQYFSREFAISMWHSAVEPLLNPRESATGDRY